MAESDSAFDFLKRERELRLQLDEEFDKWRKLEVHPMQAIGVDTILLDARFHALIDMLNEAGIINKDEHHIRSMEALLRVLSEWRSEFEAQLKRAKTDKVNVIIPFNSKKLH
jgi:hypothetical protein